MSEKVISTIEDLGARILNILEKNKDSPPILGLELVTLGLGVKLIPQVDFVVWDFGGNHILPPNAPASTNANPPAGTTPAPPVWLKDIFGFLSTELHLYQTAIPGVSPAANVLEGAVAATTGIGGSTLVGQILKDLGIPQQITLSEVIIFTGILLIAQPILSSVVGSLAGAAKTGISLG